MPSGERHLDTSRFETYPRSQFLPDTDIELVHPDTVRGRIQHCLFDFDGTLSLIRAGWQDVMIPMMVQVLADIGTGETEEELAALVTEFVTRLTGKQTIYQMIELAQQVSLRGAAPLDPLEYKRQYLDLLWERIGDRVRGLEAGELHPEAYLVPGSRRLLDRLAAAGVTMYLASGTDLPYVQNEARVLGLTPYFGDHIYGALDDYKSFSKKMVIERIIQQHGLHGPEFCAWGDGYVEIEDAKAVGGVAVGVATDETGGRQLNEWKRNRLIQAGADLIIPDFREADAVLDYLGVP
ncbi:MAG: HAD family hydrolase [Armatimonadetes bacterium]|nr:HAD family hydrolase [Armatimonadota bacterium]